MIKKNWKVLKEKIKLRKIFERILSFELFVNKFDNLFPKNETRENDAKGEEKIY